MEKRNIIGILVWEKVAREREKVGGLGHRNV